MGLRFRGGPSFFVLHHGPPSGRHDFPSVVTECYQTEDGSRLQLLVNYMEKEQSIQVESGDALLVTDASGASRPVRAENGLISLVLPSRSVVALKF